MAKPIVNIKFLADLAQFSSQMQNASRRMDKLSGKLKSVGSTLSVSLTAPIAALGVVSLKNFDKQAKAIAQVEAGLRSTGNAVGFNSEQLQKMASDLQKNSLFGDEIILKDATAQLLTFTNIAGQQFGRTQQAALDLATRLDGDLKSASIQLGKALNDPVANLSALSRSGIQFTDSQKATINSLAKTNRLADAQTLILNELEKQYGGSAQAAAEAGTGPLKQLSNILGDITEEFGAVILEGIKPFIERIRNLAEGFQKLSPQTKKLIVILGGVAAAVGPLLALAGTILPALSTGFAILTGPIGLIIAGLTAIGIVIYKNWAPIKKTLVNIANYFIDLYNESVAFRFIVEAIKTTFKNIFRIGKFVFTTLGNIIRLVAQNIKDSFTSLGELIKAVFTGNFKEIPNILKKGVAKGFNNIKEFIGRSSEEFKKLKTDIQGNIEDGINNALRGKKYKLLSDNVDTDEVEDKVADAVKKGINKGGSGGVGEGRKRQQKINVVISAGIADFDIEGIEDVVKTITEQIPNYADRLSEEQMRMMESAVAFNEGFTQVWQSTAQGFLENLGTLVAGFASGNAGIGDLAGLLLGTVANMAIQLGKMAIGIGLAVKGIVEALKSLHWAVAIGAGVALIALGSLAKGAVANIAKGSEFGGGLRAFANGGIVSGPTLAMIGEYAGARSNPEVIAPLNKLKDLIRPVESDGSLELTGELKARGDELLLVIDRAMKKRNRNT